MGLFNSRFWFAVAAICGVFLGVATHASPVGTVKEERLVRFSDLDLTRSADAQVLLQRIRSAAWDVCDLHEAPLAVRGRARRCVDEAVTRAVARVDADTLTRHHADVSVR